MKKDKATHNRDDMLLIFFFLYSRLYQKMNDNSFVIGINNQLLQFHTLQT